MIPAMVFPYGLGFSSGPLLPEGTILWRYRTKKGGPQTSPDLNPSHLRMGRERAGTLPAHPAAFSSGAQVAHLSAPGADLCINYG